MGTFIEYAQTDRSVQHFVRETGMNTRQAVHAQLMVAEALLADVLAGVITMPTDSGPLATVKIEARITVLRDRLNGKGIANWYRDQNTAHCRLAAHFATEADGNLIADWCGGSNQARADRVRVPWADGTSFDLPLGEWLVLGTSFPPPPSMLPYPWQQWAHPHFLHCHVPAEVQA